MARVNPRKIHREMKQAQRNHRDKQAEHAKAMERHVGARKSRVEWICGKMQQALIGPVDLR